LRSTKQGHRIYKAKINGFVDDTPICIVHSMNTLPRHLLQASNKHQIHSLQSTPVAVVLISQILFVARGKAPMKRAGLLAKEK
jgi:hypothetical protein